MTFAQINSNLAAKMTTVTILPVSTYEIGKEYTPDYDARKIGRAHV